MKCLKSRVFGKFVTKLPLTAYCWTYAQIGYTLRCADSRLQPPHNAKHVLVERGHLFLGLVVVNRCP
jgi:hypothetical protein